MFPNVWINILLQPFWGVYCIFSALQFQTVPRKASEKHDSKIVKQQLAGSNLQPSTNEQSSLLFYNSQIKQLCSSYSQLALK